VEDNMNYILSRSDVEDALTLAGEDAKNFLMDERRLKSALWSMGLNTNHYYEENDCIHRNLRGEIYKGIRYEGTERDDKSWLESGHATKRNSKFATEAQEVMMPNTSSTSSEYHLKRI
tara:strand:+ start:12105 stop:12458 length:354 start_codon:yes stop_codon:yes gene_type:complete